MDNAIVGGSNSQVFLQIWNAASQRGDSREFGWKDLAVELSAILPNSLVLSNGAVVKCHFTSLDLVQTTCKFVECLQTLLSGKTGGKDRARKPKAR